MTKLSPLPLELKDGRTLIIRTVTGTDAQNLLNLRYQIPHESSHTLHYVGMTFPTLEELTKRLDDQATDEITLNLGAFDNGKLIGYLSFRGANPKHPWIRHRSEFGIMILKDFWGMGIAKKLLEQQEPFARSIGVTRIEAVVRSNNERGLKLYQHLGYKIEGTCKGSSIINGEKLDEHFIVKFLDDKNANWKPPVLTTNRLILRPIELSDADAIFAYAKNPNVSKYTLWEPHQTLQDSLNYIKDYVFPNYREGKPDSFGITLKENPEKVIGTVGCFWVSKSAKSMELAYALSEDHWGKGFVAEASMAVMNFCFKEFFLKRIQARCKSENRQSTKVMEKVGMKYEGTLKSCLFHRNQYYDMHYYAKVFH